MRKALYIIIEGIDGCGKTTLIKNLEERLQGTETPYVITGEPTRGNYGSRIRQQAKARTLTPEDEVFLFTADREQHVENFLTPQLKKEQIILQDRSYLTTAAYQSHFENYSIDKILKINEFAPKPDLVIYLNISVETALKRIQTRQISESFEDKDRLEKALENYLYLVNNYKETKFLVFDNHPELSLKNLSWAAIQKLWKEKTASKVEDIPALRKAAEEIRIKISPKKP